MLVIHPELPSPWSRGETAEPLVRAGVVTSLHSSGVPLAGRAIGLVQNGGKGPLLGWALTVGGMVGGSHCQLPLLAIQRPAASPSPPMA